MKRHRVFARFPNGWQLRFTNKNYVAWIEILNPDGTVKKRVGTEQIKQAREYARNQN